MPFPHKQQRRFYADYAIKNQSLLNEDNINLFNIRHKKETNDTFNRFQVTVGDLAIPWSMADIYEAGEIVSFDEQNYECIVENINKQPNSNPNFWKLVNSSEYAKLNFNNYLAKDNQEPYNPSELKAHEKITDYHPSTKKYVDDEINYAFENRTAVNSDRLDGHDSTYFATEKALQDVRERYVKIQDIIDNTKDTSKNKPLSANQGKILRDEITKIQKTLASNDVSLDELQEIVDFIKRNRELLGQLGIDSIIGLREYLNGLTAKDETLVPKDWWNNKFLERIKELDGSGSGIDADLLDGKDSTYFLPKHEFIDLNILDLIKKKDGTGSGLDADLLDGLDSTQFLRRDTNDGPSQDNIFNLGSANKKWKNIYATDFHGTALRAKYADLSEIYECSKDFEPGTILGIDNNGINEFLPGMKLLGVVTTNPGFVLNSSEKGVNIALKGQVPCKINGYAEKGQYIIAGFNGIGIAKDDYNFEESKRLVGVVLESGRDKVLIKV